VTAQQPPAGAPVDRAAQERQAAELQVAKDPRANGMDDFNRIAHVPVAVANLPVGHGGTFNQPDGGAAASVAVSWLDWQLRGDRRAAKRFVGDDCGLCQDAPWSFQRKQIGTGGSR